MDERIAKRRTSKEAGGKDRLRSTTTIRRVDKEALYINGVFESVLNEIVDAQAANAELICYLQPYKPRVIKRLQEHPPSVSQPWKVFLSLTHSLGLVSFEADVVEWRDKTALAVDEVGRLDAHIAAHQPGEGGIHVKGDAGEYGLNLLGIVRLQRIEPALSVAGFIKTSDDLPLRERTRAGNWSYVIPPDRRKPLEVVGEQLVRAAEAAELKRALGRTEKERKGRLAAANPLPQKMLILTTGFRRNQDVVAEVLMRAGGNCEDCCRRAPFLRAKDGTPYLEVHHVVTLANGGMDTVENAKALCPNCHRRQHFGARAESELPL